MMAGPTNAQNEWLARVLGIQAGTRDAPAKPGGKGAVVRLAEGMILWNQTRSDISQQVRQLQQVILDTCKNEPDFDDIKANISNLEEVLELLDDRLIEKMNSLRAASDPAEKAKLSDEARQVVRDYQSRVENNELMNEIDDNGFIKLQIKSKVTATLVSVMEMI